MKTVIAFITSNKLFNVSCNMEVVFYLHGCNVCPAARRRRLTQKSRLIVEKTKTAWYSWDINSHKVLSSLLYGVHDHETKPTTVLNHTKSSLISMPLHTHKYIYPVHIYTRYMYDWMEFIYWIYRRACIKPVASYDEVLVILRARNRVFSLTVLAIHNIHKFNF